MNAFAQGKYKADITRWILHVYNDTLERTWSTYKTWSKRTMPEKACTRWKSPPPAKKGVLSYTAAPKTRLGLKYIPHQVIVTWTARKPLWKAALRKPTKTQTQYSKNVEGQERKSNSKNSQRQRLVLESKPQSFSNSCSAAPTSESGGDRYLAAGESPEQWHRAKAGQKHISTTLSVNLSGN